MKLEKRMFSKLKKIYRLGKQYSKLAENKFQFNGCSPYFDFDINQRWGNQMERIKGLRKRMNILEKLVFELGYEDFVGEFHKSGYKELKEPLSICS